MRLDTTPTCMWYHHQQGHHLKMPTEHHNHLHFEYKVFNHLTGYKYPTTYDT